MRRHTKTKPIGNTSSNGMIGALEHALTMDEHAIEFRRLGGEWMIAR